MWDPPHVETEIERRRKSSIFLQDTKISTKPNVKENYTTYASEQEVRP